ncbi:MAG: hypothetical protein ACRCXA_00790 [Peptostreptococcaceae bacterium]
MKYLIYFLLILFFISPHVDNDVSFTQIFRDGFYDYITSLDRAFNYASENSKLIAKIAELPYEKTYKEIMTNRSLTKHFVSSGETIDDIIKKYNMNITNNELKDFRKIVYKENQGIVSDDYNIQSGQYIFVPTE